MEVVIETRLIEGSVLYTFMWSKYPTGSYLFDAYSEEIKGKPKSISAFTWPNPYDEERFFITIVKPGFTNKSPCVSQEFDTDVPTWEWQFKWEVA